MKKSKLFMWLSGMIALLSAMTVTSCVDDNDDLGMPYLEVTPDVLTFDANGDPIGDSEFTVRTNRPWTLDIPEEAQWVRLSVTEGEGDAVVSCNLFASADGQSATLTFALKNSAGKVYLTKEVTIVQGEAPQAGPVGDLVTFIKEHHASVASGSTVDLNYTQNTIEAVILANNEYGNNFGKLYVGDNSKMPNSAIVLYNTSEFNKANSAKYPVGSKVTLDLSAAQYSPFGNLRELKSVGVTVSEESVELVVPELSAAQLNTGNYQGQYVKVNNVTPQATFVGTAWATSAKRTIKMDAASGAEVQSYMSTATDAADFASLIIAGNTGAIWGTAEQNYDNIQIIPVKPSDVAELCSNDPILSVSPETVTLNASEGAEGTFQITCNGTWSVAKASGEGFSFTPESGSGNGTVTITAAAANTTAEELTLGTLTVSDGTNKVTVTVKQQSASTDILFEDFGNTPVEATTYIDEFSNWLRSGTGVTAETTYTGSGASIRTSGAPQSDALSGGNNLWITSGGYFQINNLKLAADQNDLKITFGAEPSKGQCTVDDFTIALSADGTNWVNVAFSLSGISGESYYQLVTAAFRLTNTPPVENLFIKIASTVGTRIEDLTVATSAGGTAIELPEEGGNSGDTVRKTIAELVEMISKVSTYTDFTEDIEFEGVVQNDVSGGNFSATNLILATEGATTAGNGIVVYGSEAAPATLGLNKGDKVKVTLYAGKAQYTVYNKLNEICGAKNATGWCKIEKTGTATITPIVVNAADLASYQGMTVTVADATTPDAGVWGSSSAHTSHTLTAGGTSFIVYVYKTATALLDVPYTATTGNVTGIAYVFNNAQLLPRDAADVAAFAPVSSEPAITGVTPAELTWAASETDARTVTVSGSALAGNLAATITEGDAAKWEVKVSDDGTTVTVAPIGENTAEAALSATLTLTAGTTSRSVTLTQSAPVPSGGPKTATFDFSTISTTGTAAVMTVDAITLTPEIGSGSNAPGANKAGEWRLYRANQLIVSGATITKVEITFSSTSDMGSDFTAEPGTYTTADKVGTWTGSATSVTFTNGTKESATTQARMKQIVVTYE